MGCNTGWLWGLGWLKHVLLTRARITPLLLLATHARAPTPTTALLLSLTLLLLTPLLLLTHTIVIGGGDSAVEEATYLTKYASKVYLLVRRDQLRASKIMQERAKANEKVEILWNTVATEALGNGRLLSALKIKNVVTNEEKDLPVNGLFYAIGHQPNTNWLKDEKTGKFLVQCDSEGYVVHANGDGTETNVEGVFACGDVVDKKYRQAITAAGSGWYVKIADGMMVSTMMMMMMMDSAAALDCERWLEAKEFEEHSKK